MLRLGGGLRLFAAALKQSSRDYRVGLAVSPLTHDKALAKHCDFFGRLWFGQSPAAQHPIVPFPLAQTGEGIAECEVIKWLVKEGDHIQKFDKVCEVQSDKASIEISSPFEGTVASIPHQPGDIVRVGSTLLEIEVAETTEVTSTQQTAASAPAAKVEEQTQEEKTKKEEERPGGKVLASPAVRLFAKQQNVDLSKVQTSSPGKTITRQDVLQFIQNQQDLLDKKEPAEIEYGVLPNRVPIRGYRRAMFKSMTASLSIPHFHFCDDFDMTALISLRQCILQEAQLKNRGITFLPVLMKALSATLTEFPHINSSVSPDQEDLVLHSSHNIGVAMATDAGLIVPSVKNVQDKTIIQIAGELEMFKVDAAEGSFKPEDLADTTITISNVGSIGSLYATPLIIPPQTAIVALGRMRKVIKGLSEGKEMKDIELRPMLPVSWGADHRVLDGASVVEFSNRWKQFIEEPHRLMLFLK